MTVTGYLRSRGTASLYCYNHLLIPDDDGFCAVTCSCSPYSALLLSLHVLQGKKIKYQKPGFQRALCRAVV